MPRERLPNSPLSQVACEVRFTGHFSVIEGLARFQASVEQEFPSLYVPRVQSGDAPALRVSSLAAADDSERINVAIHLFAFVSRKYSVFAEYRTRFFELFGKFQQIYSPQRFTRFGLRYTNVLPWNTEQATATQIHPWLTLGFHVPKVMEQRISEVAGILTLCHDQGSLRVSLERRKPEVKAARERLADMLVLDLDFFAGDIQLESLGSTMDEAHRAIEDAFFGVLSSDGLKAMEGSE